jgi:hypothetical protein
MKLAQVTVGMAAAAVFATAGAAAGAVATTRVSGPSPYASCSTPSAGQTVYPNAEVEPDVAANPARAGNLVAVWQQDRWSGGGAHGLVAGYSVDGGRSWGQTTLPFSRCAPGGLDYNRASDPAVSFGPDGTVYAIGLSFDQATPRNAIASAVSTDGGRTWSAPQLITADAGNGLDKEWITADPVRPGTAYAVWDNLAVGAGGHYRGPTYFAKTTDHGRSWSTPIPIAATGPDEQSLGNQVLVDRRTGRLYNTYAFYTCTCARIPDLAFVTSDDGGRTWSRQQVVGDMVSVGVTQPGTLTPVRSGGFPLAAISRTGQVYLTWQDSRFSGGSYDEIAVVTTTDGGVHWTAPHRANVPTGRPAFTPGIAVTPSGKAAVTYYDLRRDDVHDEFMSTDYWATTTADGVQFTGARHLAGSFDLAAAPDAAGSFVGDYEGLAAVGETFVAVFAQTNCAAEGCPGNRTDVYSASFGAPSGESAVDRTPGPVAFRAPTVRHHAHLVR